MYKLPLDEKPSHPRVAYFSVSTGEPTLEILTPQSYLDMYSRSNSSTISPISRPSSTAFAEA
jgi:hypothetical protein